MCGLALHSSHNRRQFYDVLYEHSTTKEVDYGTCTSNRPETDTEKALISEWIAINEEVSFDKFAIGKHISEDRIVVAVMRELGVSVSDAIDLLTAYKDIYDECESRRRHHCICGEYSKLYFIINRNTKKVLLVGSNCIKTVQMDALSGSQCIQCGKSTKGVDGRFGRCADCILDPTFMVGSHKGQNILDVAITNHFVSSCIKDDRMYLDIALHITKTLRTKLYNTPQQDNGSMLFSGGKHAGETFHTVYTQHRDYADWILSCDNPHGIMIAFKKYVLYMDESASSS